MTCTAKPALTVVLGTCGVPEITPVVLLSASPGGSTPEAMLQTYGALPPLALSVAR